MPRAAALRALAALWCPLAARGSLGAEISRGPSAHACDAFAGRPCALDADAAGLPQVSLLQSAARPHARLSPARPLTPNQPVRGERRCEFGPESAQDHASRSEGLWEMALEESGLDSKDVSEYGCSVPKIPWSFMEQIQAMNHTKVRDYNFQGSYVYEINLQYFPKELWDKMYEEDQKNGGSKVYKRPDISDEQIRARSWMLDFAKANFNDDDYLKITDTSVGFLPWKTLGKWDHTLEGGYDHVAIVMETLNSTEDLLERERQFDADYFEVMAQSKFTLCPGGDMRWSMRFYEAIAAGSIPIINDTQYDLSEPWLWALYEIPYKYYILGDGDVPVYRQDWADYNLDLFIKYQTFGEGDQQPPQ